MQLDENTYSTKKDKNGEEERKKLVDLENWDERMELLRHLKVIVPIGINLVESGRTKENQTGSHI